MTRYSIEPKTRKYVKGYGFLSFARNLSKKYGKELLDTATKTGIDAAKAVPKKVVHKTAEATGQLIRNEIAEKIVKQKLRPYVNSRNIEETVISPKKRKNVS